MSVDDTGIGALLDALDARASLAQRHLALLALLDWVRGDRSSVAAAAARVRLVVARLQANPARAEQLRAYLATLGDTVDATVLLADFGFAPRTAFFSELLQRLRLKLLPATPETADAAELFAQALPDAFDTQWLATLDPATLAALGALLTRDAPLPGLTHWQHLLLEALNYCGSQILAAGLSAEMRLRMDAAARESRPFHALASDVQALREACIARPRDPGAIDEAAQRLRLRLDACRRAALSVYDHLEAHGISVGLVFLVRQVRARVLRMRELLDALLAADRPAEAARLLGRLAQVGQERRSLRALFAANSSLLAARVAERNAETGSHYITRTAAEYRHMLAKAAGGGAVLGLTTLLKFAVLALGLSAFWSGFWAGMNYAASFVLIYLLGFTVATKQPAMTAPAMVARLREVQDDAGIERFVDEVAHLVRSQVAAIIGNVLAVAPAVLLLMGLLQWAHGLAPLDEPHAREVLDHLTLLGPTALFAAFTGLLLFASSVIAGWVENAFVLARIESALRYNPRITRVLGVGRASALAAFLGRHVSGLAANVSLGLLLGLVPAFAAFFGVGLEVRHVTLSMGQVTAAAMALGLEALTSPALWWCVIAVPVTGLLNVTVSFWCAFRLALAAQGVGSVERDRIRAAIRARLRHAPRSFLLPPGTATPAPAADRGN